MSNAISKFVGAGLLVLAAGSSALAAPPAELPDGASTLSETYGDWTVSCRTLAADNTTHVVCAMSQRQANKNGQTILTLELRPAGEAGSGVIVLPFGLAVTKGVALSIDGVVLKQTHAFSTCLPAGCIVPLRLDAQAVAALKAGKSLVIKAASVAGRPLSVTASLKGFSNAYARTLALTGQ